MGNNNQPKTTAYLGAVTHYVLIITRISAQFKCFLVILLQEIVEKNQFLCTLLQETVLLIVSVFNK